MKKLTAMILSCLLALSLCACGEKQDQQQSSSTDNASPLSADEISQMYTTPDNFKGRQVTVTGKVYGDPEKDSDGVFFQMFGDPSNSGKNSVIGCKPDVTVKKDEFVKVTGTIEGTFTGKNAFGGDVTAPKIRASSVDESSYIDAVSPTIKSVDVNSKQSQKGYDVTVQKVEFAASETRVYVDIANNGKGKFSLYSFNAKAVQNSQQYGEQSNYEADYPELQTDLLPGTTTSGIIVLPILEQSNFQLVLEASSDNFNDNLKPYTYAITVQQ